MRQQLIANAVLDRIFKKLLIAGFEHARVLDFIKLQQQFNHFSDFITYLSLISHKPHDEEHYKMAAAIQDYLDYLVSKHQLTKPLVSDLVLNQELSNLELYLYGVRGYDGFLKFYFDDENNLYLCLDNLTHETYKELINIAFLSHKKDLWLNKQNTKILHQQFNQILVFKKHHDANRFLGNYRFLKLASLFADNQQLTSFILVHEDSSERTDLLLEYDNLNHRHLDQSLTALKTKLQEQIIHTRSETYYFLNLINIISNHHLLIHTFVQHCLNTRSFDLLAELASAFGQTLQLDLSINALIPKRSWINEYYLMLLANSYDILYGAQITADYQHNIFMCLDNEQLLNETATSIEVRFIKSYKQRFFNLDINKKIFMTTKTNSMIYVFIKRSSKQYLFLGYYKVSQVLVGKDLQNQPTPIFKLRVATHDEIRLNLIYNYQNQISNAYKNAFLSINQKQQPLNTQWADPEALTEVKTYILTEAQTNSNLFKYNWILKKLLQQEPLSQTNKYWQAYFNFETRISFNLLKALQFDFKFLITNQIMEPATIAYQMTKHNWANPELFKIAYMDYYLSKQQKYAQCLAVIDSKQNESK